MSLYYVPWGADPAVLRNVKRELAYRDNETVIAEGSPAFVWTDWDASRYGPARDPVTGVRVILSGRLALPAEDWRQAETLPFEGGLAARKILRDFLAGGVEAVAPYNGPALLLIEDPRSRSVTIWTDQFGYHPGYIYGGDNPETCVVTTFPDLLLCDPRANHSFDQVSMAEFLRGWRTVPPHTYFAKIKHLGPATRTTIDLACKTVHTQTYWTPFEDEFYPSIDAAADALAEAITNGIRERTAFVNHPVFMISGGADSRVLLFAPENRAKITGVNLYERRAVETKIAQSLAEAAGSNFRAFQRDRDFYPRLLPEIVHWSGAMWSAEDSHYLGFADAVADLSADLVMTACTTDWLFKGYGLEKRHIELFGRNLPFFKLLNDRREGFLPNAPTGAPPLFENEIRARMSQWFEGAPTHLRGPRDFLKVEDKRVRPTCYAVSVSGAMMTRTYPYDTFLADSRIAECYSRSHPKWKLNRELWGKAAARVCSDGGRIDDANFGWPVDAGTAEKAIKFATGWLGRRLRAARADDTGHKADDDRAPSSGSWPDTGWYADNSETLRELWHDAPPDHRERMRNVAGEDPWDRPLGSWRSDGPRMMRIATLLAHWREVENRQKRSSKPSTQQRDL